VNPYAALPVVNHRQNLNQRPSSADYDAVHPDPALPAASLCVVLPVASLCAALLAVNHHPNHHSNPNRSKRAPWLTFKNVSIVMTYYANESQNAEGKGGFDGTYTGSLTAVTITIN
jgi:hypothetical protein